MREGIGVVGLMAAATAAAQPAMMDVPPLEPGLYSNEEQVYFAEEAGRPPPPRLFVEVLAAGGLRAIDAFGAPAALPEGGFIQEGSRLIRRYRAGEPTLELRRARPASCWVAMPKTAKKADGSTDWHFVRDLKLHDQGGRALAGGGESGAAPVILRMRNVVWATGPNRPSLVLYVHRPDSPNRAESYAWADPDAKRIGINLRWMQASCTIDPPEGGIRQ